MPNHADIKQRLSSGSGRIDEVNERIRGATRAIERVKKQIEAAQVSDIDLQDAETIRTGLDANVERLELEFEKGNRKIGKKKL